MSLSFLGLFDEDDDDDDDDTCIIENGMIISECLNVSTCDSVEVHSVHDLSSSEATTSLHAMLSSTPQRFSSSIADGSSMDVSSIPSIDMSPISEPLSYSISSDLESASAACTVSHACVIDQAQVEVEREVTTLEARSTVPWCGFKLVGDNLDKTIRRRHQLVNRTTVSLHYFNSFAIRDRIDLSAFDENRPDISLDTSTSAECLLPTKEDLTQLLKNFEVLIGRMLVNHMPPLHRLSDVVVKNIKHKYYAEMSQKSEVVSSHYNYVHV